MRPVFLSILLIVATPYVLLICAARRKDCGAVDWDVAAAPYLRQKACYHTSAVANTTRRRLGEREREKEKGRERDRKRDRERETHTYTHTHTQHIHMCVRAPTFRRPPNPASHVPLLIE